MLKIKVNSTTEYKVDFKNKTLNSKEISLDISRISPGIFHIIQNHETFRAEVLEANKETKTFVFRINGNQYQTEAIDEFDALLHKMGLDKVATTQKNELKAPMPGLVIDVRHKEGDAVKKGDDVLVLEAMKMENILRSPGDGIIKKLSVQKGDKVEKNQTLLEIGPA